MAPELQASSYWSLKSNRKIEVWSKMLEPLLIANANGVFGSVLSQYTGGQWQPFSQLGMHDEPTDAQNEPNFKHATGQTVD